jgi:hypothetical protein
MFDHISWIAVIGAAIAAFVFNAIWYTPLFGDRWARLQGLDPNSMAGGPSLAPILAINFALNVLGATALAVLVKPFARDVVTGVMVALFVWVASGLVLKLNDLTFARRPAGLFYIDAIGHLITLVLMGVIVSLFRAA